MCVDIIMSQAHNLVPNYVFQNKPSRDDDEDKKIA
jgi:hypothetical protein